MASSEYTRFLQTLQTRTIPPDASLEDLRRRFETWLAEFPVAPEVQMEPCQVGEIPAVWALAPEVTRRRILLFFHGGGYTVGSIQSHKNLIGRLSASCHAAVLAIDYRLAPEHPFPAALDDALSAYRWLLHRPYSRSRILFAGISAGAGLTLALLLKLQEEQIAPPAGAISLCPWVDLTLKGETIISNAGKDLLNRERLDEAAKHYAGNTPRANPFISPLYGDLEHFPPLFIQTGTRDLLHAEAKELAKKAESRGVSVTLDIWKEMVHGWQMFAPAFPEAQEAIDRAGKFVNDLMQ